MPPASVLEPSPVGTRRALTFGLALLSWWVRHAPEYFAQGWLHAKLGLIALLFAFHVWCAILTRRFAAGTARPGATWLKWFNEVPALILIAIVVLVVVKPF